MAKVLNTLEVHYGRQIWRSRLKNPFEILTRTILSQNTTDINADRAFDRLKERFEVKAKVLAEAAIESIRECIGVAGLGNIKARRIKEVSALVESRFGGDLSKVLSLPLEEARAALIEIPGIGDKTTDVVLVFAGGRPVIPVDTHLFTVGRRLGVVKSKRYDEARKALEMLIPPERRGTAHLLLLNHGKEICTARKAWCSRCPINRLCMKISVTKS